MIKYLLLYVSFLSSCGIFTDFRTITVSLPEVLPPWFQDAETLTGEVFYPGPSGYIENNTIDWNESFKIKVEKGSSVPIACYPSGYLKPAGAFLSLDSENGQALELEWSYGFLSDLLLEMMKKGVPVEHINIQKLSEEIESECNGDPWSIDRDLLKEAIIYNALSVYKIKAGDGCDIILPIEGTWISDNPFYPSLVSISTGELILKDIYPGLHRFQNPVTKEQLDILVEDDWYEYLIH